jgi:cyclomaltodextrinase
MEIPLHINGLYEHYKKKQYRVLGIARHSENLELHVIYQALYNCPEFGNQPIWIRPLKMFTEEININGVNVPRFKYVSQESTL